MHPNQSPMKDNTNISEAKEIKLAIEIVKILDGLSVAEAKGVLVRVESLACMSARIQFVYSHHHQAWQGLMNKLNNHDLLVHNQKEQLPGSTDSILP